LYAFPRRRLEWRRKGLPRPHVLQEYERAGALFRQDGDEVVCLFDRSALKTFYLRDVLIHEIGHHVDRFNRRRGAKKAERFAHWFVREHGFRRANRTTEPLRSASASNGPLTKAGRSGK
jgi:hypothetical protein